MFWLDARYFTEAHTHTALLIERRDCCGSTAAIDGISGPAPVVVRQRAHENVLHHTHLCAAM